MTRRRPHHEKKDNIEKPRLYYSITIAELRTLLNGLRPTERLELCEAKPPISRDDVLVAATSSYTSRAAIDAEKRIFEHILWMFDEMEKWPSGKSAKAGRWIGWVFAVLEVVGTITNEDSRRMAKLDSDEGKT